MTRWATLVLLLGTALVGCAPKVRPNQNINAWLLSTQADVAPGVYSVQPPDVLEIAAPKIDELNGRGGAVGPDGRVSLNLLGEVFVAGKTTDQIAEELRTLARKYYTDDSLDISVRVTEYRSKVLYVFGQVDRPGIKPFTGRDTVLRVLAEASLNERAWPQKVVVIRPSDDPKVRQQVTVNLKEMYQRGDITQNFILEEGDMVFVPLSPMAQVNVTFTKLLIPMRPVATGASLATGGI